MITNREFRRLRLQARWAFRVIRDNIGREALPPLQRLRYDKLLQEIQPKNELDDNDDLD